MREVVSDGALDSYYLTHYYNMNGRDYFDDPTYDDLDVLYEDDEDFDDDEEIDEDEWEEIVKEHGE